MGQTHRTVQITRGPNGPARGVAERTDREWLARLGRACFRHRRSVLTGWIVGVVVLIALAGSIGPHLTDSYTAGNSPSQQAQALLNAGFPARAGATADVVVRSTSPLHGQAGQARLRQLAAGLRQLPHVAEVDAPTGRTAQSQIGRGGHIGYIVVHFDGPTSAVPPRVVRRVITVADSFDEPGFHVALGGAPVESVASTSPGSSEGIGLVAAVLIMLVAFGSVVAMGLPILTALIGVGAGVAAISMLSHLVQVASFGPEVMVMIGLGVGIDYALLVLTRYRQALAAGHEPVEATAVASQTAGASVLLAGCTVVIALLGLFLTGIGFMEGLAVATVLAVALVMAATLTLLPALLGFVGHRIDRLRVPGIRQAADSAEQGRWYRWSRMIQRRPWLCAVTALVILLALAAPAASLRMAFTDAGNDPPSQTTRQAYDLLATGFGPGANGPLILVAETSTATARAAFRKLPATLRATPGVAAVSPAMPNRPGSAGLIIATPTTSPEAAATASLVHRLRRQVVPKAMAGSGVRVLIGGQTASGIDVSKYLSGRTPWVIALVVAMSMLLLGATFHSVLVPSKAAAMNLLSIGGAYGVIVAVFQWGWAGDLFGTSRIGPIDPWIPLTMFTITFGLSMDYEVFLLSRIREHWLATSDNARAVTAGLAATGRVITAAAAIMICVFGSFVVNDPMHILNVFGLGLASAILIDATLVRMVLAPAIMQVAGRANWWFPTRPCLEKRLGHHRG